MSVIARSSQFQSIDWTLSFDSNEYPSILEMSTDKDLKGKRK